MSVLDLELFPRWRGILISCRMRRIRLVSHLYNEALLDQPHFLDWLLTSFEASTVESLPILLLLLQLHWGELVLYRRSGKRLAAIILEKVHLVSPREIPIVDDPHTDPNHLSNQVTESDGDDFLRPLRHSLSQLAANVMTARSVNFVLCRHWPAFHESFGKLPNLNGPGVILALNAIRRRNDRLSAKALGPTRMESATRDLLHRLDTVSSTDRLEDVFADCLALMDDRTVLIRHVLEWATSIFRQKPSRLFLALYLIRRFHDAGIDTDDVILTFLGRIKANLTFHDGSIYLLVAELALAGCFSVGRYLQWIIARGALDRVPNLTVVRRLTDGQAR